MQFISRTHFPVTSTTELFHWHQQESAFERLNPPWQKIKILNKKGTILNGDKIQFKIKTGPFWLAWHVRHESFVKNLEFSDRQIKGPFHSWLHRHRFEDDGQGGCWLIDDIQYELPFGSLGNFSFTQNYIERKLRRLFKFRHEVLSRDLAFNKKLQLSPKRILLSGASGLIGSAAIPFFESGGHQVVRLTRGESKPDSGQIFWNPRLGFSKENLEALNGFDLVIHLGATGIAEKRWTSKVKAEIRDSRIAGTTHLVDAFSKLSQPPNVFICASAIGIYGDRKGELLDESSKIGDGFLADVCKEWEACALGAKKFGVRVVNARFGIVLSPAGGALSKMLTPFRLGIGGYLGDGLQWMSWISIEDLIHALLWVGAKESFEGPVNFVAPLSVTNATFSDTLASVLGKSVGPKIPRSALRLLLGREMADSLLLSTCRVHPQKILDSGFEFNDSSLLPALSFLLGA